MNKAMLAGLVGLVLAGPASLVVASPAMAQDWRDGRREWRDDRRDWRADRRDWRDDRRDWRDARRDWRDDRRDWRWNGPRYRSGYYYPRGYGYNAWGVGYAVPRPYWGQRYWVNDWRRYQLARPWGGTRWVRVGPDALLIDVGNGVVIQAVRGLWW